jgi:hypothetical protein
MEHLSTAVQEARFWRASAGQLRHLAQAKTRNKSQPKKLIELASRYERLADKLVEDWGHARN